MTYTWVLRATFLTTGETISDRLEAIPVHIPPRTFADAIIVTRKLGIRYLWVDSLCNIQHDSADWARESGKMAEVYRRSRLTLAGTMCTSTETGLLHERRSGLVPIELGQANTDDRKWTIYGTMPLRPWTKAIDKLPLNRRAWAFQERL